MVKRILCIGDSNTYGYDPRSYFGSRYPDGVCWADQLEGFEVINCGLNGMTVPRSPVRSIGRIRSSDPDLVIVMLGTNDLLSGLNAEQITDRMEGYLASLSSEGARILLISPPILQYGEWVMDDDVVEESQELGGKYLELAERMNFMFADSAEWEIEMTFDGVHFSPEGHKTFAEELNKILIHMK